MIGRNPLKPAASTRGAWINRTAVATLCLLTAGIPTIPALAGPRRFDAETGADPNNYPPDCPVDFLHLKLELLFEDLTAQSFSATATYTLRPVREGVTDLTLNAEDLYIDDVATATGPGVRFEYDDKELSLRFAAPLPPEADTVLTIRYRCIKPIEGMVWALPDSAYPDRPPVIHTQGEAEYARYWFPCLDSPVDRCTTEIVAEVPTPFFALSNGKLIERRDDPKTKRTAFHYRQDQPHVFYLVSLVIGQFNEVADRWRDIDVQYFVQPGKGEQARLTYGRTPEMIEFFSKLLHFDYPYAKYSQVTVPLFFFGGMENTSATTVTDLALLTPRACIDQDLEGLIAHELAHQWFGDLLTCRSWKHIWLNEGFATFMNTVWLEESKDREEYLYDIWTRYARVAENDRTGEPPGILFSDYRDADETFFHKGSMPYTKGSCVLHMLRHQLGDEVFWRAVAAYVNKFAYSQVETEDLRRVLEAVSGLNLEQFFDQWVRRPGVPHLSVRYGWDEEENAAYVTVMQTQHIDRDAPAFQAPLDLYFRVDGKDEFARMELTERKNVFRREFARKPELFCADPNAGLLMELKCDMPRSMWQRLLVEGPTTISRCLAAKNLARFDRPEVIDALRATVADAAEHRTVRKEAAEALGAMRCHAARDTLVALLGDQAAIEHPKVRAAVISAAGTYDAPEIGKAIAPFAASDESSKVEAEATEALGNIPSFDAQDILVANADKESYYHQIRVAAIEALAKRNDPKAIDVAGKYAAYGQHDRVRPVAVRALGRLARANENRRSEIRATLMRLLTDPQDRTVWAAIDALADIGDAESTAAIRRLLSGATKPTTYRRAGDALEKAKPESESDEIKALRRSVDELRQTVHELRERQRGGRDRDYRD